MRAGSHRSFVTAPADVLAQGGLAVKDCENKCRPYASRAFRLFGKCISFFKRQFSAAQELKNLAPYLCSRLFGLFKQILVSGLLSLCDRKQIILAGFGLLKKTFLRILIYLERRCVVLLHRQPVFFVKKVGTQSNNLLQRKTQAVFHGKRIVDIPKKIGKPGISKKNFNHRRRLGLINIPEKVGYGGFG